MKHTKMFSLWKPPFLNQWLSNKLFCKAVITIVSLTAAAVIIWFGGPYFDFHGYNPLYAPLTRFYLITSIYLIWIIKFLLVDIETTNSPKLKDNDQLALIQYRFRDAIAFLKNTTVNRQNKTIHLSELPWYLLIGPKYVGKTSLLAKSEVNYLLQKQTNPLDEITSSEQCDWWVTPDASIIDVPGRYCAVTMSAKKVSTQAESYRYFLELAKAERGKQAIQGILLALPLAEIVNLTEHKLYTYFLHTVFSLLNETKKIFTNRIPVTLIITKCDALPGFNAFFSEQSKEEMTQAWGIQLPIAPQRRIHDFVANRFNALIKKLNQQLLWRLHHERNPALRPSIKDFPLQIENLKELLLDFVRKYNALQMQFPLQGIYLTSALQKPDTTDTTTTIDTSKIDGEFNSSNAIQLFKTPAFKPQAYFIKQLFTQGLRTTTQLTTNEPAKIHWFKIASYTTASAIVGISAFYLISDFKYGINKIYGVKSNIMNFQFSTRTTGNSEEHLQRSVELLNILQTQAVAPKPTLDFSHVLKFYSYKSQLNVSTAYHKSLQTILLPTVRNYLADALKQPINQTSATIYATLQSYLMLGDKSHLDTNFLIDTIKTLPAKTLSEEVKQELYAHIRQALKEQTAPMILDKKVIQDARQYLTNLPTLQLAYTILKGNNAIKTFDLKSTAILDESQTVFTTQDTIQPIPLAYTSKAFTSAMMAIPQSVKESITGNWVVGLNGNQTQISDQELTERINNDLRELYIKDYISTWENLLANIELVSIDDLPTIENMISRMTGKESPLLKLLQVIHDNTYFSPIIDKSEKLQNIGILIEKSRDNNNLLYQIFASLKSLHQYLEPAVKTENHKKASFSIVSERMKGQTAVDAITQLRLIAAKSPEPLNLWLTQITDETWNILIKSASQYIDTSWQSNVIQPYNHDIANRFPFNNKAKAEVKLDNFVNFFGNAGIVIKYFNHYLQPFIDTSSDAWHWKIRDNKQVFLSEEKLRQIQYAIKIHRTFFPNNESKLNLQFTLQPYQFGKKIQNVKLNIDDKVLEGNKKNMNVSQAIRWPSTTAKHSTKLQLTIGNKTLESKNYDGDWGLFKLINQYFETAVSKKQMVINFSLNDQPAKYILITEGQYNPFMSFNLNHFNLPDHLN